MKSWDKIILLAAAMCACSGGLFAAQVPVAPTPGRSPVRARHLSLSAALDMASRQNLDLAAARLRRAVSAAGIEIARQRPNPSTSFAAGRDTPHESVTLGQTFELGGKRRQRIEVAEKERGLTDLEIANLERQVRRQVREAFYSAALARGVTSQREEALGLARQVQATAQARFDAGEIAQLEVFQADLEVSRAEADRQVAQQEEKVAFSRLNALLNEPADTAWDLRGELESFPPSITLPDLVAKAGAVNPELLHLSQESKIEQSRQRLLRTGRVPDLNFELGLDLNAPDEFRAGPRAQVSVDLPLFSRNQGELAQSLANERVLDSTATATRRSIAGEVEAAYYEVEARRSEVRLYGESLLPASRRLAGLAQESYSAGRSPIMTLLDAQRNVQQLERDYLNSVFALQRAFAQLEETVGTPLD